MFYAVAQFSIDARLNYNDGTNHGRFHFPDNRRSRLATPGRHRPFDNSRAHGAPPSSDAIGSPQCDAPKHTKRRYGSPSSICQRLDEGFSVIPNCGPIDIGASIACLSWKIDLGLFDFPTCQNPEDRFKSPAWRKIMVKPISEQLANLSVRAKNFENAVAAAEKETHDKVVARIAQAQAEAEAAVQKVDQNLRAASDSASTKWNGLRAKVAGDMDSLKAKIAQRKHDVKVKRAANYAEMLDQ